MTNATLSHPDRADITFPVRDESDTPLVSRSFGKPHGGIYQNTSGVDPTPKIDQFNGLENYAIQTQLWSTDAYKTVLRLADLVKSPVGETPVTFEPGLSVYDSSIDVVPQAEEQQALTLTYPPGSADRVQVDLGLTRVDSVLGTDRGIQAETPRASGDGPIEIRDSSTQITLAADIEVERTVGRPNSTLKRKPAQNPQFIDKQKAAYDAFSLNLQFTDNPAQQLDDALAIFRQRRGRSRPTLDFNGRFGMGQFKVQLDGSAGWRDVSNAGTGDVQTIPAINLRVVDPT
jgi:hypothetical protein